MMLRILTTLIFVAVTGAVTANESAAYQLQYKHLMNPTESALQRESRNQAIYIYEGMKLADVDQAMDTQFDRVENMMFVSTRLPATEGGEEKKADDGCD